MAETYDEVVFTDPSQTFFHQLQNLTKAPTIEYSQQEHFLKYSDTEDMKALLEAEKFLKNELVVAKERLMQIDTDLAQVDDALRQQQEQRKKAAPAGGGSTAAARPKPASSRPASSTAHVAKKAKT